jgi:hypothetical protein
MCTSAMTETLGFTEPTMPRRPSLALALLLAAAALTACADPTAPKARSSSAAVRHSGYLVICGDKDSTNTGGAGGQ